MTNKEAQLQPQTQPMQPPLQQPYQLQDDEIDLRELFRTIWKKRVFVISFTLIVTLGAVVYVLITPNVYESKAIFVITNDQGRKQALPPSLEGFISVPVKQSSGVIEAYKELLDSYAFMREFIIKSSLYLDFQKNPKKIYAMGLDFSSTKEIEPFGEIVDGKPTQKQEDEIFKIYKKIKSMIEIKTQNKVSTVTFTCTGTDVHLNQKVLSAFLEYAGLYLKDVELRNIEAQIDSLKKEIEQATNIDIRNGMLELITTLYKRKVFLQAETYSGLNPMVLPEVPHIRDKAGPKRALIVTVAAVTGFILSIFGVFFMEFIQGFRQEDNKDN